MLLIGLDKKSDWLKAKFTFKTTFPSLSTLNITAKRESNKLPCDQDSTAFKQCGSLLFTSRPDQ